jgi:hypothetical protein
MKLEFVYLAMHEMYISAYLLRFATSLHRLDGHQVRTHVRQPYL